MRILHAVEFYHPVVGGAQEVVRQVSERLARKGHEVTVATSALRRPRDRLDVNGVRIREFAVRGNLARGLQGDVKGYQDFLLEGGFDVVLFYAAQQWTLDAALPVLDRIPAALVLAPCGFSGLRQRRYRGYFRAMPGWLAGFDRLLFHSASYQDFAFARRHGLGRLDVVPNGAAEEEFGDLATDFRARHGVAEGEALLLTVGSHTGIKGHREAMAAFRRVRRTPATLLVVGNRLGLLGCLPLCRARARLHNALAPAGKRIVLASLPRADTVAALKAADLFVFPSNVECAPIVLYEAMAAGTPFLATPCGNAAEVAALGGGAVVASRTDRSGRVHADPRALAGAIEGLLADAPRRQAMAQAGRRAWREGFTWDAIADRYEQAYRSALAERSRRGREG